MVIYQLINKKSILFCPIRFRHHTYAQHLYFVGTHRQCASKAIGQLATSMVGEISDAFSQGGITAAGGAVGDALAQMVSYIAGLAPQPAWYAIARALRCR